MLVAGMPLPSLARLSSSVRSIAARIAWRSFTLEVGDLVVTLVLSACPVQVGSGLPPVQVISTPAFMSSISPSDMTVVVPSRPAFFAWSITAASRKNAASIVPFFKAS